MSNIFNQFIEQVFGGNPHAFDSELGQQLDADCKEYHQQKEKWLNGSITLLNGGSVEEWVAFGRPRNPNL